MSERAWSIGGMIFTGQNRSIRRCSVHRDGSGNQNDALLAGLHKQEQAVKRNSCRDGGVEIFRLTIIPVHGGFSVTDYSRGTEVSQGNSSTWVELINMSFTLNSQFSNKFTVSGLFSNMATLMLCRFGCSICYDLPKNLNYQVHINK